MWLGSWVVPKVLETVELQKEKRTFDSIAELASECVWTLNVIA